MGTVTRIFISCFILLGSLLTGCSPIAKRNNIHFVRAEPRNLDDVKVDLVSYYKSDYSRQLKWIFEFALAQIRKPDKTAVILDVAETLLSNWQYEKDYQLGFHYPTWKAWVDTASSTAVPHSQWFFHECLRMGVDIYVVTGRFREQESIEDEPTVKNLTALGFVGYKKIVFMEDRFKKDRALLKEFWGKSIADMKGYETVINIGDQPRDFWKHRKVINVKVPNPFYRAPSEISF